MDVIPLILTEEAANSLPIDILTQLAECSTEVIKKKVKAYLDNPDANKNTKKKITEAYFSVFEMDNYLSNPVLIEKVNKVKDLNYANVNPSLSDEQLLEYTSVIREVLSNPMSIAYIPPISGVRVKELIERVNGIAKDEKNDFIKNFVKALKQKSSLFRDSRYQRSTGTAVKNIVVNRVKFEIILKGLEYLQMKRKENLRPMQWRIL